MKKDLTEEGVLKAIIYFSIPYLLSYFLQTLYGMVDLFIIGQFNGVDSITSVSIGSQVMHMLTVMIVGLAMGSTIMIARGVGAKNNKVVNEVIGNTATLIMTLSIVFSVILILLVKTIVSIMATPSEAISGTNIYLIICFAGIPFITAYNIISSIFRGMGDSKSPMYFIAIACVFNIALDYLFIGVFKLGASGAALGTTLSQAISVIISLIVIKKRKMIPGISYKDFKIKKSVLADILKVGVPISIQDGFIQISFIIITVFANLRGVNDAAAVGIVEKLIGMFFLVPSSMLSAVSALSAQNIGAVKDERAEQTLKYATIIAIGFGTTLSVLMMFIANPTIALFSSDTSVITLGGQYMRGYVWDCIFAGIHFSFSGYFYAYELSSASFIHNFISIICARIPLAWLATKYFPQTLLPMGIAAPIGSLLSVIICIGIYIWMKKHPEKLKIKQLQIT